MSNESSLIRDSVKLMVMRDLRGIEQQVAAYPDDESLWIVKPGISNSAGVLAIHAAGALRHFVGSILGKSGFGQIDYHRRLLTPNPAKIDIISTNVLAR